MPNAAAKMHRARHAAERRRLTGARVTAKLIVIEPNDLIGIEPKNAVPDWMYDRVSDFSHELRYAVRHGMA